MMTPERIRSLLLKKGLNVTPQRVVITDYLLHTVGHPCADEVFEAVKERLPSCSKATVYNTLNTLVEARIIHAFSPDPGKTRYDANMHPHHHFIDTNTGVVHDIPWEQVDQLCQSLGGEFKVEDYQITFYGEHRPAT